MMRYYVIIIFMTLTAAFANFFLKKSTENKKIISIIQNKYLYFGGLLYIIATFLNIWILKYLPYSVVVPLGSICQVWIMIIAGFFLKEKIGKGKIVGIGLIIFGVVCIAM